MLKSSTVVPRLLLHQRLGEVLHQADLISQAQIEVVLNDQEQHLEMRFGEILALRGWLKQETSDFFAEQWQALMRETPKTVIGRYLEQAGLLDKDQVESILEEQTRTGYKFGAIAVLHGWMRQQTLDFFLDALYPGKKSETPFMHKARPQLETPAPLFISLSENSEQAASDGSGKNNGHDATIPWIN